MTTVSNVKGMLLEEILLFLLDNSGYIPVTVEGDDSKLLHDGHSGLELDGRGARHQIDVIADFSFVLPFVNPLRLLIEAKCYGQIPVGLPCVRNAFGVLSDVNERWNIVRNEDNIDNLIKRRYHYYYAIFSTTGFTKEAMNYAYVHDIFLFDISSSAFIHNLIMHVSSLIGNDFNVNRNASFALDMKRFRMWVRSYLQNNRNNANNTHRIIDEHDNNNIYEELQNYQDAQNKIMMAINECLRISKSYMAILGKRFPVFVTPNPEINIIQKLKEIHEIEIYWNDINHFYIEYNNEILFSFSLPNELFNAYQQNGDLSVNAALNMKQREMSTIQIFMKDENEDVMPIKLDLNMRWLNEYKNHLQHQQRNRH